MGKYESKNAGAVLEYVEKLLEEIDGQPRKRYRMRDVYDGLSVFDWWTDYMGATKLKDMQKFLKAAIDRGYTGYVCFKVGASGCANGMWAHVEESEDGYSPSGAFLYKSFTPDYNCWSAKTEGGEYYPEAAGGEWNSCRTVKQLDAMLEGVA